MRNKSQESDTHSSVFFVGLFSYVYDSFHMCTTLLTSNKSQILYLHMKRDLQKRLMNVYLTLVTCKSQWVSASRAPYTVHDVGRPRVRYSLGLLWLTSHKSQILIHRSFLVGLFWYVYDSFHMCTTLLKYLRTINAHDRMIGRISVGGCVSVWVWVCLYIYIYIYT